MIRYFILLSLFFIQTQFSFSQTQSKSDILIFNYDESYLTVFKHTPNCYFIADIPIEDGFCFEFEKEIKYVDNNEILDMRNYVYKFKKTQNKSNLVTNLNVTAFSKHLANKQIYFRKEDSYVKVRPLIYIE